MKPPQLVPHGDGLHYYLYHIATGPAKGKHILARRIGLNPPKYSYLYDYDDMPSTPEDYACAHFVFTTPHDAIREASSRRKT